MTLPFLDKLSPEELLELDQTLLKEMSYRKLEQYRPYKKQMLFHEMGATYRERLFRAGNQTGKTHAGAAEASMHATGLYPKWWQGRRFDKPTVGWCTGVTGEVTRDSIQRLLLGPVNERGTGFIPRNSIADVSPSRGVADLTDTIHVKHVTGGNSRVRLKYYEQGREKFQAETLEWAWNDEEPPEDIYTEILTRTNATNGIVWTTFTPLKGMSEVVRRFLMEQSPDRIDINMVIDDAEHITPEMRTKIIASYAPHEREARINGTPMLGSGRIFPIEEKLITCERFELQNWHRIIGGLDFGWDHPTAAVRLAHDPDTDIIYVTHAYKRREATPVIHASALKPWGKLKFAWPHDGFQHDKQSGIQTAQSYRNEGLDMMDEQAQFPDDRGNGVEAGITEMLMRMETGRWKVFSHLTEWFEEFRLYHRQEGKVVKEFDDLMSASRYGLMCLNDAQPLHSKGATYRTAPSWMSA